MHNDKIETLRTLVNELKNNIVSCDQLNAAISKAPVGWHIQHTLLTLYQIIKALENSKPENYSWKLSLARMYIYGINRIPRGKAKAPVPVQPKGEISPDSLIKNLAASRDKIAQLSQLHRNSYFEHPYFGKLNLKPSIWFLILHTRHHIRIIHDITGAGTEV